VSSDPITLYTAKLTDPQAELVQDYLKKQHFQPYEVAHARYAAKSKELNVVFYNSGKLVVQGKGTQDFVQYFLEPDVFKEARLGYEEVLNPKAYEPHIGVDESGKGDFFGPLVVSAVFATREAFPKFKELKVRDSKTITSDKRAMEMAREIKMMKECQAEVILIGPEAYNRLHLKMRSVNDLLGWGHARAIENLLSKIDPKKSGTVCLRALSDQFGNKRIIERALMERGKTIELEQRHRAEEDPVVAAASIVARAEFISALDRMSKQWGVTFPKGASNLVVELGKQLVQEHGPEVLGKVAKTHFRTKGVILGEDLPPKKEWRPR
jgi:ribonuclease HIII